MKEIIYFLKQATWRDVAGALLAVAGFFALTLVGALI